MRTSRRIPFLLLVATATVVVSGFAEYGAERRHTRLLRSVPAKDSTIAVSPARIELYFNERIQLPVSRVRLETPSGDTVPLGPLQRAEQPATAPVVAEVRAKLAPGRHMVRWSTASKDGHVVRDSFAFTLRQP